MRKLRGLAPEELARPEGWECDCGRRHAAPVAYLRIGGGAIESLPEGLKALGARRPMVYCDENTREAAGRRVEALLRAAGVEYSLWTIPAKEGRPRPAEWELGSMGMHFDGRCDFILGIGSGVINDLCKRMGYISGRRTGIVGTAPSMDGYASDSSSMEVDGIKTTLYNPGPEMILCDTEIMARAPMRMLWAGVGDMLAKYVSICEWRIAHIVTGEYYCENVAELMRGARDRVADSARAVARREPGAVRSVAEGLITAGLAMAFAGISRPASGIEHYFSHMWEMQALERGKPYDLHGVQVGVGTLLALKIYGRLIGTRPDPARAEAAMARFDPRAWEADVWRIFGSAAPGILEGEKRFRKNDPRRQKAHMEVIAARWEDILGAMREELPDARKIGALMRETGMPTQPEELGISWRDVADAFRGTREIRDKYVASSLLWDMGLMEDFAGWIGAGCPE